MFRSAFKRSCCLIPASGYYEWHTTPTGKQPYYFTASDSSPLTIAGLWDEWKDIETGHADVKAAARTVLLRQVCLALLYITNNDDGERDFQCEPRKQKRSDFVSHRITPWRRPPA
jgi:hypothetical protein